MSSLPGGIAESLAPDPLPHQPGPHTVDNQDMGESFQQRDVGQEQDVNCVSTLSSEDHWLTQHSLACPDSQGEKTETVAVRRLSTHLCPHKEGQRLGT